LCRSCHIKHHKPHKKRVQCDIAAKCKHCGIEFLTTTQKLSKGNGKYCSNECKIAKMSQPKTSFMANCLVCGKEFQTTPYKQSIGKGKYCSSECSQKAQTGVHKYKPITKQIPTNCLLCGKEFSTTQDRLDDGRGKYCSKQCMYKARSILKTKSKVI